MPVWTAISNGDQPSFPNVFGLTFLHKTGIRTTKESHLPFEEKVFGHFDVAGTASSMQTIEA